MATKMLEVNDVAVAKRRNFNAMYPSLSCCIDGFPFHAAKFVIQPRMEVVRTQFREIACKVVSSPWFDGGLKISFLNRLRIEVVFNPYKK